MSNVPSNLKYVASHEWIRQEGDGTVTVGISDHAQEALGDIVFVEVPEAGRMLSAGESCAVVESVKAASDVYAPISGEVVGANGELKASPELINQDPYGKGWMWKIKIGNPAELAKLLDAAAYEEAVKAATH